MTVGLPAKIATLVVDESISQAQLSACKKWLKKHGCTYEQLLLIAEQHPGISDHHIIKTLLNKADAVLTADRPFHNLLLKEGWHSLYADDSLKITQRPLSGIRPAILPPASGKHEQRAPMSSLHNLIMPQSEAALKKLRSKRRRIRSHFGGYDQLQQLNITVAVRGSLVGIRMHAAGASATGIMASESYIKETGVAAGDVALAHALILALQLMLHPLHVSVFYDPANISDPELSSDAFFNALRREFPKLKFLATSKGRHMESLWQKLNALSADNTNEIVASRLTDIRERFSQDPTREIGISAPQPKSLINPNTDRGALLLAAKWFVDRAKNLEPVKQIALVGSICTDKRNPKDIDIVLTIAAGADIAPLSKLKRQMQGRIQRGLLGADVFLVEEGQYIGRPCRFREPHPRVACAHADLRCSLDRAFLCDTSATFTLKDKLLASPPIVLYPEFQTNVSVPADVRSGFDLSDS
jgi:hypothetical protein